MGRFTTNYIKMKRSKSLQKADAEIDRLKRFPLMEAIGLMKKYSTVKFDATAEIHFTLGINPKHADQQIRTTVSLPNGTGKKVKIVVFCADDKIDIAKKAGADEAGGQELIDRVLQKGWTDFDVAVATPDIMKNLAKAARVLGPKGLMPSPKAGTVSLDIEKTVKELVAGRLEFRNDKTGVVHTIFGKLSFDDKKLLENLEAMIKTIREVKPAGQKGIYFKNVTINSTMGTGIKIEMPEQ
jgi:large subunit ribosomal protein L1